MVCSVPGGEFGRGLGWVGVWDPERVENLKQKASRRLRLTLATYVVVNLRIYGWMRPCLRFFAPGYVVIPRCRHWRTANAAWPPAPSSSRWV